MKIGSEAHKELFCRSFLESHQVYEPENLPWPEINASELEALRSVPFWKQALKVEQKAGIMVSAFAATIEDPLVREAIDLQGKEEARHARLIRHLIERYDIEVEEPPEVVLPEKLEPAFTRFGYGECLDSFLAFGTFDLAREARALPEGFFQIFDPLLDEESRHIHFFVNWIAYEQIQRGRGAAPLRAVTSLWHYGEALQELIEMVGDMGKPASESKSADEHFAVTDSFLDGLTLDKFLSACIEANEKRMAQFDPRLLQPSLLPILTKIVYRLTNLVPKRQSRPQSQEALG